MVKLTIPMIESRGKGLDYQQIIHLNLWGTELHDVSIFLEMPRLEILSLSLNKLVRLDGLRNCHKLQELYLRKNLIENVDELIHLKDARNLQIFTLLENPVATILGDNYRSSVLRMLPQLCNLDGLDVSPSEVRTVLQQEIHSNSKVETKLALTQEPVNSKRVTALVRSEEWNQEIEHDLQHDMMDLDHQLTGRRENSPATHTVLHSLDFMPGNEQEEQRLVTDEAQDKDSIKPKALLSRPRSKSAFLMNGTTVRQPKPIGNPLGVPRYTQTDSYVEQANYCHSYELPPRSFPVGCRHDELDFMHYRATTSVGPAYTYPRSMIPNPCPGPSLNYYRFAKPGPLRSNANLLSSLRSLIRELEPASLVVLSQAIHDQMEEMPPTD